ncbi:MAG TPA: hypothetical protein VL652_46880, partial [Kutzneria sp.]|nr:hypothetical protein [Kutzneria sp.]
MPDSTLADLDLFGILEIAGIGRVDLHGVGGALRHGQHVSAADGIGVRHCGRLPGDLHLGRERPAVAGTVPHHPGNRGRRDGHESEVLRHGLAIADRNPAHRRVLVAELAGCGVVGAGRHVQCEVA